MRVSGWNVDNLTFERNAHLPSLRFSSKAATIEDDRKGTLFRAAFSKTKKLGPERITHIAVWKVRRRGADARIDTAISCHTFRATGITDYVTNGGRIEVAQRMAGHSNAKTTGRYDGVMTISTSVKSSGLGPNKST